MLQTPSVAGTAVPDQNSTEVNWTTGLTAQEIKGVQSVWVQYYPFVILPENTEPKEVLILYSRLVDAVDNRKWFPNGIQVVVQQIRNVLEDAGTLRAEGETQMPARQHQGEKVPSVAKHKGGSVAAPPPQPEVVVAVAKKPTAEEQAASDAAAEAAMNAPAETKRRYRKKDPDAPKPPKSGKAPGGLSWVEWFRKVLGEGMSDKDAQAAYVELRKDEPAYSGAEGLKKLQRHAYHHRKLAENGVTPAA